MAGKERAAEALRDLLEALREKLDSQSRDEGSGWAGAAQVVPRSPFREFWIPAPPLSCGHFL